MCQRSLLTFTLIFTCLLLVSCSNHHDASGEQIVEKPEEMDAKIKDNIYAVLQYAKENNGKISDSINLHVPHIVDSFYQTVNNKNVWSKREEWMPVADSLYYYIQSAEWYGLFPKDYHFTELHKIKERLLQDSTAKADANLWTKADLMLTDAFMQIARHLKQGRLQPDSLSLSADTAELNKFFIQNLNSVLKANSVESFFTSIQPKHTGYVELQKSIKKFIDSMDRTVYTYVRYPGDSSTLIKNLKHRLREGNFWDDSGNISDSVKIISAIKKYQKAKGMKADGKISSSLINALNSNDLEKYKRIAINMDRFKHLPGVLPQKYIWVNLPSYFLQVWDNDTIVLTSKVVVGKPSTKTPQLTSQITDMITYPNWTIPNSIIKKDILPALKKNAGYLASKGFNLVDGKGETVNPYGVNWAKYTTGIPYKIVQGSGDANALGIFKFNFNNPYSVYLHDTNQRYLFSNASRALSHGCVRVQEWQKLAFYIATNDSSNQMPGTSLSYTTDSIKKWIENKERRRIIVKNKIPLFIRYFTCEGKNGKVIFYDDIYGEDKLLKDKYFARK